jgi:putative SOS response-associated peptidase YedK
VPLIAGHDGKVGVKLVVGLREEGAIGRCLVPGDGFFEWQRTGKVKQPYCFEINDGELFAFAGLWDRWKDATGKSLETFSILTTISNSVMSLVHNRMPVILNPDSYDLWLDPGMKDLAAVSESLQPCDARLMRCFPVSDRVNSVINHREECSRVTEVSDSQRGLFS